MIHFDEEKEQEPIENQQTNPEETGDAKASQDNSSHEEEPNGMKYQDMLVRNSQRIFGNTTMGNMTILQNMGGDFITPVKEWSEPTDRFTFQFDHDTLDSVHNQLLTSNIVMLYCAEGQVVDTLCEEVLDRIERGSEIAKFERGAIFWREGEKNEDGTGELHSLKIDVLLDERIRNNVPKIIKVDLSSEVFFSSLFFETEGHFKNIERQLAKNNVYLLCKLERSLVQNLIGKKYKNHDHLMRTLHSEWGFTFFKVPFVRGYLVSNFPELSEEEAQHLVDEVGSQIKAGHWGPEKCEENLTDVLSERGWDTILIQEEIDKRKKQDYKGEKSKQMEELDFKSEPNRTVLFVATFFPNISVTEFHGLVEHLLTDEEREQEFRRDVISEGQGVQTLKELRMVPTLTFWQGYEEQVFEACKIESRPLNNGQMRYDFEMIGIDRDIKHRFKTKYPPYVLRKAVNVLNSRYLFYSSPELTSDLHRFISFIAHFDPQKYVLELNKFIYHHILNSREEDDKVTLDNQQLSEDQEEELKQLQRIKEIDSQFKVYRFLDLMGNLLSQSNLIANKVLEFFELYVLNARRHSDMLFFLEHFSSYNKVDELHWIKKVLERSPDEETERLVINSLVRHSRAWGNETEQKLTQIAAWLPEPEGHKRFSKPEIHAMIFALFSTGNPVNSDFPLRLYGEWPTRFVMLAPLAGKTDFEPHLEFLINWLFNPCAERVFENKNGSQHEPYSPGPFLTRKRCEIIESWILIIEGVDRSKNTEISSQVWQALIKVLSRKIDKDFRLLTQLQKSLTKLAQSYTDELIELKYKTGDQVDFFRQLFESKRSVVLQLHQNLTSL